MSRLRWHKNIDGLLRSPTESLGVEIKDWLDLTNRVHQAILAKAIIALANHGGGVILIGLTESDHGYVPSAGRPADLSGYSTDTVNSIVQRFAEPVFHCDLYITTHPKSGQRHPAIIVPGGHDVPIRSKRAGPDGKTIRENVYYIRRPGPASAAPQSGQEWNDLLRRCIVNAKSDLLDQLQLLFARGTVVPNQLDDRSKLDQWYEKCLQQWHNITAELDEDAVGRFPYGFYSVAYMFSGVHNPLQKTELRDALRQGVVRYTGWPPFSVNSALGEPYPVEDGIACWFGKEQWGNNPTYADYWRVSSDGMFFLIRGYQEDGHPRQTPGTGFDLTLPTWRLGEILLHAASMAEQLGLVGEQITLTIKWHGLADRKLINIGSPDRILTGHYTCQQQRHSATFETPASEIRNALTTLVANAVTPLYELFEFFRLPPDLVVEELNRMRTGRN